MSQDNAGHQIVDISVMYKSMKGQRSMDLTPRFILNKLLQGPNS